MFQELWVVSLIFNVALCAHLGPRLIRKGLEQKNYPKTNFGYSWIAAGFGWSSEILYALNLNPLFRLASVFFLSITAGIDYAVFGYFIRSNKKFLNILRWIGLPFGILVVALQSVEYAYPLVSAFSVPYALMIMYVMSKTLRTNPQSKYVIGAATLSIIAVVLFLAGVDINQFIPLSALWQLLFFWAFFK